MSGKLRLDSSAKRCALLSVFGSRSIVFVLLSPGRIPSELLVVSAAGGLSVRGVQKSSVTCQLVPLASPERDLTDAATFTSARRDPGAVQSKVCKLPAEFLTPDTWFSLHRWPLRMIRSRLHCSHSRRSTEDGVNQGSAYSDGRDVHTARALNRWRTAA